MKPTGPRWEKVKKVLDDKYNYSPIGIIGGAKEVFFFGRGLNWVLKIIQPMLFDYLRKLNYVPGTKEWAQRVKIVVENHLSFINENFPGLFPRTRVFIGQAETKFGKRVHIVNKLQAAISEDADPDSVGLDSYPNLSKIINENPELRKEFRTLYQGMKRLKEFGLALDIGVNRNYRVNKDAATGKFKLYLIDSMPLYLLDAESFKKYHEEEWGYGKDYTELVTITPNHRSKTYTDSIEFFNTLKTIFEPEI